MNTNGSPHLWLLRYVFHSIVTQNFGRDFLHENFHKHKTMRKKNITNGVIMFPDSQFDTLKSGENIHLLNVSNICNKYILKFLFLLYQDLQNLFRTINSSVSYENTSNSVQIWKSTCSIRSSYIRLSKLTMSSSQSPLIP